jgi:cell wall-associated NlpC family hydrolase
MGVYIGGGNFIHARTPATWQDQVPLSDSYYVANWVGARRVL